jgi:hypothetical protein
MVKVSAFKPGYPYYNNNMTRQDNKEPGSAGIIIDLSNSHIKVYHTEDNTLLLERDVIKGFWDDLFILLRGKGVFK